MQKVLLGLNLKSKILNLKFNKGFTLIELMVVTSIMAILATVLVINLNGERANRDIQIAENQLVSNIRLVQSESLSERELAAGQSVQYYFLKFDLSKPTQYTIQAVYNVSSSPKLQDLQTILLPPGIRLASGTPITITRPITPATQSVVSPSGCALIGFVAPFAKTLLDTACSIANAPNINMNDDYWNLINFVTNTPCISTSPLNPPACNVSSDSSMSITLTNSSDTVAKTVTINGISGSVSFN